jgi:1-acyl-sn-glycerol-3-phosphate acyltransferase
MRTSSRLVYRAARIVVVTFYRTWLRLSVFGGQHVPATGAFILAPGAHRSILDASLVSAATPRIMRYMGAEKYFETPALGRFLRSAGGFPVDRRSAGRAALGTAEAILASGQPLVMFPESRRREGPTIESLKDGPAFLAQRTGVPIVPVGIGGAARACPIGSRFIRPSKVTLVVGEPLRPPAQTAGERVTRSDVSGLTSELQARLQALFDQAQAAAGQGNQH